MRAKHRRNAPRKSHFVVVVLGLGGMGLAACRELARRGVRVLGVEHCGIAIAAVVSGHGFQFVPVVGEARAGLALAGRSGLPIDVLSAARVA